MMMIKPAIHKPDRISVSMGFTLIELLVVIAIIAILSSILLPIIHSSLEKGRTIACASNMKNIGQAIFIYTDDYDGLLPAFEDNGTIWDEAILGYLGNENDIFLCPSDPFPNYSDPDRPSRTYAVNGGQKYVAKNYPFGGFDGQEAMYIYNLSSRSGSIILLGERPGTDKNNRGYVGELSFCTLDQAPGTVHRKGEGANYLFADISVVYLRQQDAILTAQLDYWYSD